MEKHILVVLSADPPGRDGELAQWSTTHVQHMIESPFIDAAQAFRVHPRHNFVFPETRATRPAYQNLCVYEINENRVEDFLNPRPGGMPPPDPPGGVGPHRPDGYLFVAATPQYRSA